MMLEQLAGHLNCENTRLALHLGGRNLSWAALAQRVAAIQQAMAARPLPEGAIVAVAADVHADTYASLLAVLLSGYAYLPLLPDAPLERNVGIAEQSGTRLLLAPDASAWQAFASRLPQLEVVSTAAMETLHDAPALRPVPDTQLAYVLFTSGSTGQPKGVPITRGNLRAFLDGLYAAGVTFEPNDRVLQMFDLTFDFSVMSVFAPWVKGASIFVAGGADLRFMSVYRLLEVQELTCAPMVPSALNFLRPYFGEIQLDKLRSSVFCGEALLADIAAEWSRCTPNGQIFNFYGPTEATVFCSYYRWTPENTKAHNGALSIGRAMRHAQMLVCDEQGAPVPAGQQGEICLCGAQLTPGYMNDPAKNAASFFVRDGVRFYRTGDLGIADDEGDILFLGRSDQQVKIQGFRIELAEVEHHARACDAVGNAAAVAVPGKDGTTELVLCIEGGALTDDVKTSMRGRVPHYMVPNRVVKFEALPLNVNGKVDRPKLRRLVAHPDR